MKLHSWKEIADHIGVNPRTAQRWETERDLPVHRDEDNGRGVWTTAEELDRWKEAVAHRPGWWGNIRLLRFYTLSLAVALIVAGGVVWMIRVRSRIPGPPAAYRWEEGRLIVTDAEGREKWQRPWAHRPAERSVWIGDLEGNGRIELLLVDIDGRLLCVSDRGEELWQNTTDWQVRSFRVTPKSRIAATGSDPQRPGRRAVLLASLGKTLAEYRYAGEDVVAQELDVRDNDVLLAGLDTDRRQAALFVLDAETLREKTRVWFPRTRLNRRTEPHNGAYDVVALPDGTTVVQVREQRDGYRPFILYLLDRDLKVLDVVASTTMRISDLSFSDRDVEELRRGVEVRPPEPR
jgi:hypothetical protein